MKRLLLATSLLALATSAQADLATDFKACAGLVNGAERLACYDGLARQQSLSGGGQDLGSARPAAEQPQERSQAPGPAASAEQQFGMESIVKRQSREDEGEDPSQVMRARWPGEHKGWKPDTKFVLDNGQVWRNVDGTSMSYPLGENPAVTIEKGMLGAYWMSFDALNKKLKVKRVR